MSGTKQKYNVYRIESNYDPWDGTWHSKRTLAGTTWAVSEAKARVNVEYRTRGMGLYGGFWVHEMGGDGSPAYAVHYEAVLADNDT